MSFRAIRSESFAPLFRGLSLCLAIGAFAALVASTAPGAAPATRSANWRWGMEDGIRHIEYDWQPRSKPARSVMTSSQD